MSIHFDYKCGPHDNGNQKSPEQVEQRAQGQTTATFFEIFQLPVNSEAGVGALKCLSSSGGRWTKVAGHFFLFNVVLRK